MTSKSKPLLNPKDEKFCQEFIKTGVAAEAYRNSRVTKCTSKTSWENASKIMAREDIAQRVNDLQIQVQEKTLVTVAS